MNSDEKNVIAVHCKGGKGKFQNKPIIGKEN